MRVYLAGPINGCSDGEANDWRTEAKALIPREIGVLDPMSRDYRGNEDEMVEAIVHGDLADIAGCDAVIANCPRPSWGTAMEIHWTASDVWPVGTRKRKTVAIVPAGTPISPWLRYHTDEIVSTLNDAVKVVTGWLMK